MNHLDKLPKFAIPVVVAGIIKEDKILLLKRSRPPFKGLWSLPGGKIKFGELVDEAVRREIKEETSIELANTNYKGVVYERIFENNSVVANHIIFVFSCEPKSANLISSEEGEVKWFDRTDFFLHIDDIIPTDFLIVKKMFLNKLVGLYNCSIRQHGGRYKVINFVKVK